MGLIKTTTNAIEGYSITRYITVLHAEVIYGTDILRDIMGGIENFFGARSDSMQEVLKKARREAMDKLEIKADAVGADALIGISVDYEAMGPGNDVLMVVAVGTAVELSRNHGVSSR